MRELLWRWGGHLEHQSTRQRSGCVYHLRARKRKGLVGDARSKASARLDRNRVALGDEFFNSFRGDCNAGFTLCCFGGNANVHELLLRQVN